MFEEKEKIIKEKRLAEVVDKDFLGLSGKFGCILRHLGHPVVEQGSSWITNSPPIDVWAIPGEEEIPTLDRYESTTEVGRFFDGLPYGMHLEIKYTEEEKTLTVYYKGYMVYCEEASDLKCFVPHKEWEELIERLYRIAKKEEPQYKEDAALEKKMEDKRDKLNFLEKLKKEWGFNIWS
jgi:hypothetical protein